MSAGKLAAGQWSKPVEPFGTIHGPTTLFVATVAGTATGDDGEKFEMFTGGWGGGGPPIVRCVRTGLHFSLSWENVIRMALAAGITREHPEMAGK